MGYCFPKRIVVALAMGWLATWCQADGFSPIRVKGRELFLAAPRRGVRMESCAYYARAQGLDMVRLSAEMTKSDKRDVAYQSFSDDNGQSWSVPEWLAMHRKVRGGTLRRKLAPAYVDPKKGILIQMIVQGVLPTDDPLEGMKHWTLRYRLSRDGGKTFYFEGPVIQQGTEYDAQHPLQGVWVGRTSAMIGDKTCVAIRTRQGRILQPIQITPAGPDGEYHNPGGGYTYHDAAVLIGRWNAKQTLDWDLSERVRADPARSKRGMLEPTLAEMDDGRILMVMRGAPALEPPHTSYRWYAVSNDGGRSFSNPRPWTYTDGQKFYSPSACSRLIRHSNGHVFWIGNICPENPRGGRPRYPLVIGEVDPQSLLLDKASVVTIDTRKPEEPAWVMLSNFYAHEDRVTHDILVYVTPFGKPSQVAGPASAPAGGGVDFTGDACIYRIGVSPAQ